MEEQKKQVVVIGNGMTGLRFCERLLEYDAHHEYRVTILGDELIPAYDRVDLTSTFGDKTERELIFSEVRWYTYHKMELQLGARVSSIQPSKKTVTTDQGDVMGYDHLVMATGARPHIPKIEGAGLEGVHVYRQHSDVDAIQNRAQTATCAVVIGGGLLGLEAAEACKEMGLHTTIIEQASHLMACQLDPTGGQLLRSKIEALDISVRTGEQVVSLNGKASVETVHLATGELLPADLVVLATGIQPNDELGRAAGLAIGSRGGIAVDETVHTSDPSIFAIGECASFMDETHGLVAPGYAMAEVAAAQLGGINKTYEAMVSASQLKLLDLQVCSIGTPLINPAHATHLVDQDLEKGIYKKLVMDPVAKQLIGAILMGETSEFSRLKKRIEEKTELPEDPKEWLAPIGQPFEPDLDLEDDDVVCFCNYVTKGDICRAIDRDNLKTTGDVMGVTYAAGLCGSCLDLVDQVTKHHVALREK